MAPEKGVVYGPPDVVDFMEGSRSLGEFCQTHLNANGDLAALVRGNQLCNSMLRYVCVYRLTVCPVKR